MSLYPTKTRLRLLDDVNWGRVYVTTSGTTQLRVRGGQNIRRDAAIRELAYAGWVELSARRDHWQLTAAGREVLNAGSPS